MKRRLLITTVLFALSPIAAGAQDFDWGRYGTTTPPAVLAPPPVPATYWVPPQAAPVLKTTPLHTLPPAVVAKPHDTPFGRADYLNRNLYVPPQRPTH